MKKIAFIAAMLALSAFAETNSIDWRYGRPGVRVVTNAPSVALFTAEVARVEARIDGIGFADIANAASNLASRADYQAASNKTGIAAITADYLRKADTNGFVTAGVTNGLAAQAYVTAALIGAWHNPPDATNWTWTSDGTQITLTDYSGPAAVAIPDMLDGLPVTGFGEIFRGLPITSVSAGYNINAVDGYAFASCVYLSSVSLPEGASIGDSAFISCDALTSISMPYATNVGDHAFASCPTLSDVNLSSVSSVRASAFFACTSLSSIALPSAASLGDYAFINCSALTALTWTADAPVIGEDIFSGIPANQTTNTVANPAAAGWGATLGGMPVVRMGIAASSVTVGGGGVSMPNIGTNTFMHTYWSNGLMWVEEKTQ